MEGENVDVSSCNGSGGGDGGSSGGVGGSSSRWNPTRDQINILESLYSQGVRTPSADQIQQITNRLKEFGHIEGKNVFYWFQNHKARQRQKQKQKQESIAYMNHYLRTLPPSAPIFHPSHPNVVCSPFYVPPGAELGFYQSTPRFILPAATGSVKIRPRVDKLDLPVPRMCLNDINKQMEDNNNNNFNLKTQETLDLFPLTPTGFSSAPPPGTTSMESSSLEHSPASDHCASQEASGDQHSYFDFFSR